MLDRTFLRPIAHRGLHDVRRGVVENTAPAFAAAITYGYGIECDVRPAAGGSPVVFHDATLDRLIAASGPLACVDASGLRALRYRGAPDERILSLADLLELVAGRVPVLVEVKSEWEPPDPDFMNAIAGLATDYAGPLALMSFDPAVMSALRALAPGVPRGIVSGLYRNYGAWWGERLSRERRERLSHLLESAPASPDFYAYQVKALPTPVTRFVREVLSVPLFAWTVRTDVEKRAAARWADAPIFEGFLP
jgi:glycerophosphoryl diester phosphodiesterase